MSAPDNNSPDRSADRPTDSDKQAANASTTEADNKNSTTDDSHSKAAHGKDKRRKPREERPRERHGLGSVSIAALILALIALAGVGALGWSWYQMRGEEARLTQLSDRVAELSGQAAALDSTKANAQSFIALKQQLHDGERTLRQRLDSVDASLGKLTSRLAGANAAYREDEAAALMRLAQTRLELASDPLGAARALTLADKALAATANPALDPVHLALQREIAALQAVPQVDTASLYVQLETITSKASSLPLAGQAVAKPSAPTTTASGFNWSNLGAAFKRAFSPLIVVRHGPAARPLLPPDEAYFVYQNLQLTLAAAQLALLQHDAQAWHANLKRARTWGETWFLTSDPGVQHMLRALDKLSAATIAPELPTLGAALTRLTTLRKQRQSPVKAPAATTR